MRQPTVGPGSGAVPRRERGGKKGDRLDQPPAPCTGDEGFFVVDMLVEVPVKCLQFRQTSNGKFLNFGAERHEWPYDILPPGALVAISIEGSGGGGSGKGRRRQDRQNKSTSRKSDRG